MKILIVEDNQKLANSIKKGLEQESYAVDVLFDGESAERRILFHKDSYDAIIMDVMLPGKSGVDLCLTIRDKNITIPILMLTARDTTEDIIVGLDAGADDYLIKPFSFDELVARIKALLRRPVDVLPKQLRVQGITLNTGSRQVFIDLKEVTLTTKEFMVLEFMMRNPNLVLTRDQILAHAWDFAFDSFSNVVDVHIKNIRKKVGKKHEILFETIRGVGYRLKI